MNYLIELDDLHPNLEVDCLEIAEDLLQKYPSLILNFFVPANYGGVPLSYNREWCGRLRTLVDVGRICLGVHGHLHSPEEFKHKSYQDAVTSIIASESILNSVSLSYGKVFRGPYWGLCGPTIDALINLGYTHLYSHANYDQLNDLYKDKIKIVKYNFNLAHEWPSMENNMSSDICVIHGHTHNVCGNGIQESYNKLCEILDNTDANFLRLDQI